MKCAVCKQGETEPGTTTVTLETGGATIVFKGVPADVCANCGEAYVAEDVGEKLFAAAREAADAGVEVDVRAFEPATA